MLALSSALTSVRSSHGLNDGVGVGGLPRRAFNVLPGSEAGLDGGGRQGRLDPPADLVCAEAEHKITTPPIVRVSESADLSQGFHGWFGEEQDNAFPLPINASCVPGVLTRFEQKYTLSVGPETSGGYEAVEVGRETPVILAIAVLDTPSSRKQRSSFSLPSSREKPASPSGA